MQGISRAARGAFDEWRRAFQRRAFLLEFSMTAVFAWLAGLATIYASNYVQARPGVVLPDPVLALLPPTPLRWQTHLVTYLLVFSAIFLLLPTPRRFLMAWQGWGVVLLFRVVAMLITPFEAPPGILPILDPLAQQAADIEPIIDDLFFSGHTATAFLLTLFVRPWWCKALFLAGTVFIAGAILFQHVHYAVDIYCAPVFSYASYRIVLILHTRGENGRDE